MESFIFSYNAVFPVFLIILLGFILKRSGFVTDEFISISSKVVFRLAMPVLVFRNISRTDFDQLFQPAEIILSIGATFLICVLSWMVAGLLTKEGREKGAFVQGSFRSNIAIIATAIAINMYGPEGAARVAMHLCFLMPFYNVLAVIVLTVTTGHHQQGGWGSVLKKIVTNPLILAAFFGLPFSLFSIPIPSVINGAINYTAQLTLPLALIGIGGSLSFGAFGKHPGLAILAGTIKLLVLPAAAVAFALLLNLQMRDPGVLFLVLGGPTATSSYIMTREMGGDAVLQANIIALTTLSSMFTLGMGIFLMKFFGWV